MRVLLLTPTLGVGGAELLTITWAAGLKNRGHTAAVAYGRFDARRPLLQRHGIEAFRVSDRGPTPESLLEWCRAVRGVIARFRPDVIYAQSITTALIAALTAPRLPLLVTVHGIEEGDQRLAALILRGTGGRVTAVSEASAVGITHHLLAPAVEVLAPGIDPDAIVEAATAPIPDRACGTPRYCCVARHHRAKGIDVLIRAFADVRAAIPEATLTLVGGGDELELNRRLAAGLGLDDGIDFVGFVSNSAPYLRRADITVLPSRREGLPIVALESFALGRPLVATAVGGTPSVVRNGETGWLVPPEDPSALAAAMVEAGRDADEARARGERGRTVVRESFTSAKTLDRIEGLLAGFGAEGGRRSVRRSPRTTPATRSAPYYLAVRVHARARIERARLRKDPVDWRGVRILGYHRVLDSSDVLAVRPGSFRAQMEATLASGAVPLRLAEALDLLEQPVPGRYICVTFDDAFHDVLENAAPILRELKVPATVFAPSAVVDGKAMYDWYRTQPRALTWEEILELVTEPLFDVQAHSRTHPRLPALSEAEAWAEIAGCKADIERRVGYPLTSFCYPAGLYGEREMRLVAAAGYRAGIGTAPGTNAGGDSMFALKRTMIRSFDTLPEFEAKVAGMLDRPSAIEGWLRGYRSRADAVA